MMRVHSGMPIASQSFDKVYLVFVHISKNAYDFLTAFQFISVCSINEMCSGYSNLGYGKLAVCKKSI